MKWVFLMILLATVSVTAQVDAQIEQTETVDTINVVKKNAFRRIFSNIKNSTHSIDSALQKKQIPEEKNVQSREYHAPSAEFAGNEDSLQIIIRNDSIYDFKPSSRLLREAKSAVVVAPRKEKVDTLNTIVPESLYSDVDGLTIRTIRIVQLKPFGASVKENVTNTPKPAGKAANAVHIDTREYIVRNMLLFREGDTADGFNLAHSERHLRSFRYINDARIIAVPVSDSEADVTVIVQDAFPYSANVNTNLVSNGYFSVTNRNIAGLGLEMEAGTYLDTQKDNLMGYRAILRSSNIGRTFTTFQAEYLDRYENQRYGFSMQRDFYSPTTKYAGHLIFYDMRTTTLYHPTATENHQPTIFSIRYNLWDAWLGRSFEVIDKQSKDYRKMNLTASFRAQRLEFSDRPEFSEDRFYRFQSRTTYLASLSWSQQMFYKTSMLYNFGRTEDIPYGEIMTVVGGREINEKYLRTYLGMDFATGYFVPNFGYIMGSFAFGTFFRNKAEQGIIDFQTKYITNMLTIRKYQVRTFISGRYTGQLFDHLDDRFIISGEHGIPAFRNDTALGRHRLIVSLEQCIFTPLNIYDFRFVVYGFAHLGWLDDYNNPIIFSTMYSSFGLGLRIRNNRLAFKTIQIEFAYFHNATKPHHFKFSNEDILRPREFRPAAPEVLLGY
ncbi:MAG: hypothetical protein FWH18_04545 [Marinilabiliaceae bacterium]|nr:hypothetical protein [Marinilabiliaceae bacterium]